MPQRKRVLMSRQLIAEASSIPEPLVFLLIVELRRPDSILLIAHLQTGQTFSRSLATQLQWPAMQYSVFSRSRTTRLVFTEVTLTQKACPRAHEVTSPPANTIRTLSFGANLKHLRLVTTSLRT